MNPSLVAVIDGNRARFLALESAEMPEFESGPNLVERGDIANSNPKITSKTVWAKVKPARIKGGASNQNAEFERRFAQEIANQIVKMAQDEQAQRLLLVAEPQILGVVREALASILPQTKNLQIQEIAKDLCKLKPFEIHQHLANKNLLPARRKVSM